MPQLPPKLHKQRLRQVYRELHRRQDQVLAELRKG